MKTSKILMYTVIFIFLWLTKQLDGQSNIIYEDLKIAANDGSMNQKFGYSVSIDNGIIAVGAPFDDENGINSGAAYLFEAATGTMLAKLLPDDGISGAEFGYSIDINNGIVAVGARADSENGEYSGAAYIFDAIESTQLFKLTPNDAEPGDEFGNSIALNGDQIVIGAWHKTEFGTQSGAAYLFNVSTGSEIYKILPNTGGNYQNFGVSVAIDGGHIAIGARTFFIPGEGFNWAKAYIFDTSNGNQINIIEPGISNYNGDLGGNFADCLDMDNGLLAVGAPSRSVVWDFSGAAYIFDIATGEELHFLIHNELWDRDHFGCSVSMDNGVVVVGSQEDDDMGADSGSAFLFDANTGQEIYKLLASDGDQFDLFGNSVAIQGDYTVIGAKGYTENHYGSSYVFHGLEIGITHIKPDVFNMYPNPCSRSLTIKILDNFRDNFEMRINNSMGQLMKTITEKNQYSDAKVILDVSEFQSGIYMVSIQSASISFCTKLIVK